jgi:hypothetical protein
MVEKGTFKMPPPNRDFRRGRFMRKKSSCRGSLPDYIAEVLKNAVYEKGERQGL